MASEGAGGTSEAARDPRQELVSILQQRQQQIQAARGDLNLFRAAFRRLTSDGNTQRRIADIAPQLEQLLTPVPARARRHRRWARRDRYLDLCRVA